MPTNVTKIRKRRQAMAADQAGLSVEEEVKQLARDVYLANKEMNAAKKKHDKKRQDLFRKMAAESIKPFDCNCVIGEGQSVTLSVTYYKQPKNTVDKEALFESDQDTFLSVAKVSFADLQKKHGDLVAAKYTTSVMPEEPTNVTVAVKK